MSGRRFLEAAGLDQPGSSGTKVQHILGTGRSKYYPSESARNLLKECFADNPPVQLDPHQQLTGMSSDQMIQFARAIGLQVSSATFGMLEDVLLKIGGKTGRNVGERGSGQSASLGRSGSTVMESVLHVLFILCRPLQSRLIVIIWRLIFRSNLVPVGRQMRLWTFLEQK